MPDFKSDEIYSLEMYGRGSAQNLVYCDLLVMDHNNTVLIANIIGQDSKAKQVAWLLQESKTGQIRRAEGNTYEEGHIRSTVYGIQSKKNGYDESVMKVDDLTQILLVSKQAQYDIKARNEWKKEQEERIKNGKNPLRVPSHLADLILAWDGNYHKQIFDVLNDRYNTPMLEDWSEYIVDELIERGYYEKLNILTFGSDYELAAGLLRVTEEELEAIISEGIQGYALDFAVQEDTSVQPVLDSCKTIDDYLNNFAGELGARIQENIGLRFEPGVDRHHPSFEDVNLHANEGGITGLYPPQANTVMGVANTLVKDNFCFIIGEMGTGKTVQGAIVPYITEATLQRKEHNPDPQRVIVLSPAIMVEKWAREIKERIPHCETYMITSWQDVKAIQDRNMFIDGKGKRKYKKPEKWEYYVMSSELPKFTYPLVPIKDWRTHLSDITSYSVHEADEDKLRFVRRAVKGDILKQYALDNEGTFDVHQYEHEKLVVVNPEHRVRLAKTEYHNAASGDTDVVHAPSKTGFYCPSCGGPLKTRKDDMSGEHFFETFSKTGKKFMKNMTRENYFCRNEVPTDSLPKERITDWKIDKNTGRYVPANKKQECGYILWQPEVLPPDSGYRKVSPAWYINKHLPRGFFKYLIADEVHEYKSGESSTGRAFGQLVNHTEKQILLTGTLMGGMSRDIFYLLARLNPKGLRKEGFSYYDESAFNQRYGVSERSTRNRNGKASKSTSQKPGISPHLFPMHLMKNCAFLELNDMGYALPPYQEIPVVMEMGERQGAAYRTLANEIMSTIRSNEILKGLGSVATYINAMYQYADAPFNINEVVAYDPEGNRHVLGTPLNFDPDEFTPKKAQVLISNIDEQIYQHGRKNLVYVKYTGKEAWNQMDVYLYEKFKSLGYKVGILRSSGSHDGIRMPKSSRDRESWLHDMMAKHDWDILITNPRLVKVGLDLLMFPNIHFFQLDYSTYDYMQASRRSWRLKQTKDVKVFTYVYERTIQEKALSHIARKIDAAMAMQGKFSEEGLRAMADSSDGMNALAKQLMQEDVLEELETVHDIFARKNQSFEEMQSVEFQDYDGYVMNPIEGGIETVRKIAQGLITRIEDEAKAGRATEEQVRRTKQIVGDYLDMFDSVIKQTDVLSFNKGVSKKKQAVEGQQELDLFAL